MNRSNGIVVLLLGLVGVIIALLQLHLVTAAISLLIMMLGVWWIVPLKLDFSRKNTHAKKHS